RGRREHREDPRKRNDHCEAAGFQVRPPSEVSKSFVLPRFQMTAWSASVARTPPTSSWSSEECTTDQSEPASLVSRIVPARPTIQQTLSEGAEPAVNSAATLLICRAHDAPPSLENSIMPRWPTRQRVFLPGAEITYGLTSEAIRRAATSLNAEGAGTGGARTGAAAAARYSRGGDSALDFFAFSDFLDGFGPETSRSFN